MRRAQRRPRARGLTVVELLILAVVGIALAAGAWEYYRAQRRLAAAQALLLERQGHLRLAMNELARQIRRTGYQVADHAPLRVSPTRDTLELYVGSEGDSRVDTLRYYVNRFDDPPSLIKQVNRSTPTVFTPGIDSARFVSGEDPRPEQLSVVLIASDLDPTDPSRRRRLGETVLLRNN